MTDYDKPPSLFEYAGDAEALIREMKRRADVSTDSELAKFIGIGQSAVAKWRGRRAVPDAAILRFESQIDERQTFPNERALLARALAMRLAEYDYDRLKKSGSSATKMMVYAVHAGRLDLVADFCFEQLEDAERQFNVSPQAAASMLIEHNEFYENLLVIAKSIPISQVLERKTVSEMDILRYHRHGRPVSPKS